jgi:hypothetical protein
VSLTDSTQQPQPTKPTAATSSSTGLEGSMARRPEAQAGVLRKVGKVNMRGITPGVITSTIPEFMWVPPESLYVEEAYQRELSAASISLIRKIVRTWSWTNIKTPVCVRDNQGRLMVIDGQHTAIAAYSHGGVPQIPIMLIQAPSVEQRARVFVSQNQDRLVLTSLHMYFAALAANDELAVAVKEACEIAGVTILKTGRGDRGIYHPGETLSIGGISRLVKTKGVKASARVLKVLVDAKRGLINANEIAAVAMLSFGDKYRGKVDMFDLTTLIRSRSVLEWKLAAAHAMTLPAKRKLSQREALAHVWFKELNGG